MVSPTGENTVTPRKPQQQLNQALQRELDKFEAQERQLNRSERLERANDLDLPDVDIQQLKSSIH